MSNDAYVEHVRDLLASMPELRFRGMFGGVGVYSGAQMFGLIAEEQLYLKVDGLTRPVFEAAGSVAFTYHPGGERKPIGMSYWRLPAEAEEDEAEAARWARLALEAAMRVKAPRVKARSGRGAAPQHDLGPGPWDE